jgi:tRNA threonylcarbamoyl adenosine modification protein (Sua5/YciO/YrdC/YwlC family)
VTPFRPPLVTSDDPAALGEAMATLAAGGVVALPTDTVYGLAVRPTLPAAVEALFALKARPLDVALPVLVGSRAQVDDVAAPLSGPAARLAARWWPGPLTLVVARAAGFDADLGGPADGAGTVGVRWPDHPFVSGLCRLAGPLAVTSANRHGRPPCSTAGEVTAAFAAGPAPALVVDGGTCSGAPSTVVDCTGVAATCLREGALPWRELQRLA